MSIHTELDELVGVATLTSGAGCYLPSRPNHTTRMVRPRGCVGDDILLSLHTRAHDQLNSHDNTTAPTARVWRSDGHPVWVSHHLSGSRLDTHGTLGARTRRERDWLTRHTHTHAAQRIHGTHMTLNKNKTNISRTCVFALFSDAKHTTFIQQPTINSQNTSNSLKHTCFCVLFVCTIHTQLIPTLATSCPTQIKHLKKLRVFVLCFKSHTRFMFKCSNMRQTGILTLKKGKPGAHSENEPQKQSHVREHGIGVQSTTSPTGKVRRCKSYSHSKIRTCSSVFLWSRIGNGPGNTMKERASHHFADGKWDRISKVTRGTLSGDIQPTNQSF